MYASSVPLVLKPTTGSLSAQFHAVFDDWFATISATVDQLPDLNSDEWAKMFGDSAYQYPLDDEELAKLQAASADVDRDEETAATRAEEHRLHNPIIYKPLPILLPPESPAQREMEKGNPISSQLDPSSLVPSSSASP